MIRILFVVLLVACSSESRPQNAPNEPAPSITSKTSNPQTSDTIGVAIVMSGWELWIGNDKEVPEIKADDPSRYPGMLIMLRDAIDKLDFSNLAPKGSVGMVITYADQPTVRVPMGPLKNISGSALGTQQNYFGTTGVELVSGLRLALSELKKVPVAHRVLIVVGDGNDTNNESAKSQLAQLKEQAAVDQVQTFAIVYKTKLSGEDNLLPLFSANTTVVTDAAQLAAAMTEIRLWIGSRKQR